MISGSKLSPGLGDLSSKGKVFRGGSSRGGRGAGLSARGGRNDFGSGKKKGRDSRDGKDPDYGGNPNKIPLGTKGSGSKSSSGKKNKEGKPYFYTDPLRMQVDDDLANSAKRQRRADRFANDYSPAPSRRKPLSLSNLNEKLMGDGGKI